MCFAFRDQNIIAGKQTAVLFFRCFRTFRQKRPERERVTDAHRYRFNTTPVYNKAPEEETGSFIQISQDVAVSHFVGVFV